MFSPCSTQMPPMHTMSTPSKVLTIRMTILKLLRMAASPTSVLVAGRMPRQGARLNGEAWAAPVHGTRPAMRTAAGLISQA